MEERTSKIDEQVKKQIRELPFLCGRWDYWQIQHRAELRPEFAAIS